MVSSAVLPGRSTLADVAAIQHPVPQGSAGKITMQEAGIHDLINLRCQPDNKKANALVKKLTSHALPSANQSVQAGDRTIIWLAPDEWLIMAEAGAASTIMADMETAKLGHVATTEVSNAYGIITIDGKSSRDMLAKHCALDLHESVFTKGTAIQTIMGHAGIILIATGDNSFTIIGRTSFMPYLVALLADASVEYGFEYRPAK